MNKRPILPRLKGFRFPREVIAYAVWAYHRFALSTADVEDLLAERGVIVSREAIRLRVNRFGAQFARCIRRDRPGAADKQHIDEVVIAINGVNHWLCELLPENRTVTEATCAFRRIRSRVPATCGQAFRGIRSPQSDAAERGFVMSFQAVAVNRFVGGAVGAARGAVRAPRRWRGVARGGGPGAS